MEIALVVLIGVLFAASTYLFLSRSTIRLLLGTFILSNGVNLLIFLMGRLTRENAPLVPEAFAVPPEIVANPLPQALILTAIVISFSLSTFAFILCYRTYQELDTVDVDAMRIAEPRGQAEPDIDVLPETREAIERRRDRKPVRPASGQPAKAG